MRYTINPLILITAILVGIAAGLFTKNAPIGFAAFAILLMPEWIRIYVAYAKDNPKRLWFKRKLYGWGWTPVTWQGWLLTLCYVGMLFAIAFAVGEEAPARDVMLFFGLPVAIVTSAFLWIVVKTGEKPRWQWGEEKK